MKMHSNTGNKRNLTGPAASGGHPPKKVRNDSIDPDSLLDDPMADEYCSQVLQLSAIPAGASARSPFSSTANQPQQQQSAVSFRKFFNNLDKKGENLSNIPKISLPLKMPKDLFLKQKTISKPLSENNRRNSNTPKAWSGVSEMLPPPPSTRSSPPAANITILSNNTIVPSNGPTFEHVQMTHISETNVSLIPDSPSSFGPSPPIPPPQPPNRRQKLFPQEKLREQEEFQTVMRTVLERFTRHSLNNFSNELNIVIDDDDNEFGIENNEEIERIYQLMRGKDNVEKQAREKSFEFAIKYCQK